MPWSEHSYMVGAKGKARTVCPDEVDQHALPERPPGGPAEPDPEDAKYE